ncbi:OLC1v1014102C1 [Oldenlandia corymbosa var. corymbosa]|uniref:non-specific serine/threonine protein kinase n=1 Tax=Oldenlandia corymbosa var. corymbosa TaxID=529605 RepID=A0AAV1E001_OLDCO|nr:OLC1v1014102C1 [Oldenlandia corymbosa var. corymbosa]
MSNSMVVRIWLVVLVVLQPGFLVRPAMPSSSCRSSCGNNVHIPYPFGIDPGCGSPAFFNLLACMKSEVTAGEEDLLILVNPPSQNRRVLWIDNTSETMLVDWSTSCPISTSQSPDAIFSDFPNIRPSSHNVFALLNCTFNSSNHQYNGRTCDQMYRLFVIFKRFKPPCLFAESKHLRSSIAAFGCTHYVPVYHPSKDYSGVTGDLSFLGLKVEYQVPPEETRNCAQCESSGGVCGFNQQTLVETCLCNSNINPTPIAAGCGGE